MENEVEPQDPNVIVTFSALLAALAIVFLAAMGQAELHTIFIN